MDLRRSVILNAGPSDTNEILVICYAGRETKLTQNSGKVTFKRTKIDHWLNKIIIGVTSRLLPLSNSLS